MSSHSCDKERRMLLSRIIFISELWWERNEEGWVPHLGAMKGAGFTARRPVFAITDRRFYLSICLKKWVPGFSSQSLFYRILHVPAPQDVGVPIHQKCKYLFYISRSNSTTASQSSTSLLTSRSRNWSKLGSSAAQLRLPSPAHSFVFVKWDASMTIFNQLLNSCLGKIPTRVLSDYYLDRSFIPRST